MARERTVVRPGDGNRRHRVSARKGPGSRRRRGIAARAGDGLLDCPDLSAPAENQGGIGNHAGRPHRCLLAGGSA